MKRKQFATGAIAKAKPGKHFAVGSIGSPGIGYLVFGER